MYSGWFFQLPMFSNQYGSVLPGMLHCGEAAISRMNAAGWIMAGPAAAEDVNGRVLTVVMTADETVMGNKGKTRRTGIAPQLQTEPPRPRTLTGVSHERNC